jgi:hypothetical protein
VADTLCYSCGSPTTATSDVKPFILYCPNCGVLGIVTDSLEDPYSDCELSPASSTEWFRARIRSRLPAADIRTDQCTTIRVYWRNVVAGIRPLKTGGYIVSAGDALKQEENITFECPYSSKCLSEWEAVHQLVEYCLEIISKR